MAYAAGTIPVTANPAKDLMDALHTRLTGNGYTHVEDWISGSELVKVYKSAAAGNGVADFYLYMRRTADTATGVTFTVSEAWDATNKKIQRYVPVAQSVVPNVSASYTVPDAAGQLPNVTATVLYLTLNTAAAAANATNYWVSVTAARLIVATRVSTVDDAHYFGLSDEIIPGTVGGAGMPLGLCRMGALTPQTGSPATQAAGYTREPNQAAGASGNFAAPITNGATWGFIGAVADVYTAKAYAARAVITSGRATGVGSPRALPKDVLYCPAMGGLVNGDTVTFGTKSYVKMSSAAGGTAALYVDQGA